MPQRKKVLLVEDNPGIIEYLLSFFPLLGPSEIHQAHDDVETLAAINALEPELVLLDLNTVRVDSKQILEAIKKIEKRHHRMKILVITARRGEEKALKEQGADDVLVKPVDVTDLSQRIKRLMQINEATPDQAELARLLIADDEPEIGLFLKEILEPLGFEVHTACDGTKALQLFKEKQCNLAIVDMRMPKMSGAELIKHLEASVDPPKPKALIIITSALGDDLNELRRQAYPVVEKPIDVETLKKSLFEACAKHELLFKKEMDKSPEARG